MLLFRNLKMSTAKCCPFSSEPSVLKLPIRSATECVSWLLAVCLPQTVCYAFRHRRHHFCWVVCPSIRPKPEIPFFHLNMGPFVHPTNRDHFAACQSIGLSGWVSGHLSYNTWREWPEILHADVSWPPSELIRLSHCWLIFFYFWHYFDLVKWVKFGVSGHFGHALWIFLNMAPLWLKLVIFGVLGHYPENVWE